MKHVFTTSFNFFCSEDPAESVEIVVKEEPNDLDDKNSDSDDEGLKGGWGDRDVEEVLPDETETASAVPSKKKFRFEVPGSSSQNGNPATSTTESSMTAQVRRPRV